MINFKPSQTIFARTHLHQGAEIVREQFLIDWFSVGELKIMQ